MMLERVPFVFNTLLAASALIVSSLSSLLGNHVVILR